MQVASAGSRWARIGSRLLGAFSCAWLALYGVLLLAPQRSGPLALIEVGAPYLALGPVAVAPLLWRGSGRGMRGALLACLALAATFWTPPMRAAPAGRPAAPHTLTVISWNVAEGGNPAAIRPVLAGGGADLIALVEFDDRWVAADATVVAHYPYRLHHLGDPADGITLLSRYPIRAGGPLPGSPADPATPHALWARVRLDDGPPLLVVVAHPPPATLRGSGSGFLVYDSHRRDAQIAAVRAFVAPATAQGERVLLLGDFNVTEREPGYADLSAGLLNAQREAGQGWGNTWRPHQVEHVLPPLLRIDYQFSSPALPPQALRVDCTRRASDHCLVEGRFRLP